MLAPSIEVDADAGSVENSLRRLERLRGGGGWNGCDAGEGEGEGGREAYMCSDRR